MSLLHVVIVIVLVGVGLYLIDRVVPMDGGIKIVLRVVVLLVLILWLLSVFGLIHMGHVTL